jgi:hypothetical protein
MFLAYAELPGATVSRMLELRGTIEQHAKAIDRRNYPTSG